MPRRLVVRDVMILNSKCINRLLLYRLCMIYALKESRPCRTVSNPYLSKSLADIRCASNLRVHCSPKRWPVKRLASKTKSTSSRPCRDVGSRTYLSTGIGGTSTSDNGERGFRSEKKNTHKLKSAAAAYVYVYNYEFK